MDELVARKRRKRSGKGKAKITKERILIKTSPPRVSATKLIRKVNTTQRLYEKHSTNQNTTLERMTIRPGIFNQGKCTTFIHRAVNLSPEKKARMDADLHRIIQLANDASILHPPSSENLRKRADKTAAHGRQLDEHGNTNSCEGLKNGESLILDGTMDSKDNELDSSLARINCDCPGFERGGEKESSLSRTKFHKSLHNTSSSSSSSYQSSNGMQVEVINYSNPPLEVYEEFADSIVSTLHSKRMTLFPCKDYLLEARSAMQSKCNFSQLNYKISEKQSDPTWRERTTKEKGEENFGGLWSREKNATLPMMINQGNVGISARIPLVRPQSASFREYSPLAITLSPRTTILNPIEYLKRVEKTTKQIERRSNNSSPETNVNYHSNLSGSQQKSCADAGCDSWNSFNAFLNINNTHIHPPGIASQKIIYKHSNRCYIDSPQAVEFKEAEFLARQSQQQLELDKQLANHLDSFAVNNIVSGRHVMSQRLISDVEVNRKNLGSEYSMNESSFPEASEYDCCDLLDDLDVVDCSLIIDKKVTCVSSNGGKLTTNKQWCLPPSPDVADHKFYRRKMF